MERDRSQLIALKQAEAFTLLEVRPVRTRPDGTYKSDIDTVITMDVWEAAVKGTVEVVVLASGDSDFLPLVERLVAQGIETHVIGPDGGTAIELAMAASTFVYTSQVLGLVQPVNSSAAPATVRQAAGRMHRRTGWRQRQWSLHRPPTLSRSQPAKAELISQFRAPQRARRETSHIGARRSR